MRRYRAIYAVATAAVLAVAAAFAVLPEDHQWVHQHLEAQQKEPCSHSEDLFCSHLPVVSIETGGQQIPGLQQEKDVITTQMEVFDSQEKNNHLTDQPTLSLQANIRYRGNSSLYFDKHSYYVKTVDQSGNGADYPLLGMPEHCDWALNGPFLDKTLIRNYLSMNLYGEMTGYAPRVRFCELWLNGEYQGVYLLMERVSQGLDRVNITEYEDGDPFTSYIVRLDRGDTPLNEMNAFGEYAMKIRPDTETNTYAMNVEYPGSQTLTPELKEYIERDLSQIEKAIYSYDYDDDQYGYEDLLDVDSFVDYFVFNEFVQNYDAGLYSTYFYKDIRGKLHIGPIWDFNNAYDNYVEEERGGTGFGLTEYYLYTMLLKDEEFVERVIQRYRQLRETVLSEEYLMEYIDDTVVYLGDAVDRNFQVWGYSFDPLQVSQDFRLDPISRNPATYEEAVGDLKEFLEFRGNWLDAHIENLRQFCHESAVKQYNH